jgi:hypothetical protein
MKKIMKWSAVFSAVTMILFALLAFVGNGSVKAEEDSTIICNDDTCGIGAVMSAPEWEKRQAQEYQNWLAPRGGAMAEQEETSYVLVEE